MKSINSILSVMYCYDKYKTWSSKKQYLLTLFWILI